MKLFMLYFVYNETSLVLRSNYLANIKIPNIVCDE